MANVRPAAVAGLFYPGTRSALASAVRAHLADVKPQQEQQPAPKALIVPHAGFVYSGPIAASAYARLGAVRDTIRRVVLFGPTHRVPVRGLAVPSVDAFATPLGEVPIDRRAVAEALTLQQVTTGDAPHAHEHSLEVQLPFLQTVLDDFSLVPFAVGDATPGEVSEVIDRLWGGDETLIVVSSDLSHYHRYADACSTDRATGEQILAFSAHLDHEQACGATPINGLLIAARHRGLGVDLLDLRNSGDTAGDRNRVVGYASFAFVESRTSVADGGDRR
jgi:AmmeMemoRadiSam system protein B